VTVEKPSDPIDAIPYLTRLLRHPDHQAKQMIADRDGVLRVYGRMFSPEQLAQLGSEEFKSFLLYDNNRHWWGIHRHQRKLVENMDRLRHVLGVLLDESRPLKDRLDWIEPRSGSKPQPGLGKAVFTPILHVVYPDRYGVWNSIAESAMRRLGLWPQFPVGASFGEQYELVNAAIAEVADQLSVDRWTVDSLWWRVEQEHEPTKHQFDGMGTSATPSGSAPSTIRRTYASATFVCATCFVTKAEHLRSKADPSSCIDCRDP